MKEERYIIGLFRFIQATLKQSVKAALKQSGKGCDLL